MSDTRPASSAAPMAAATQPASARAVALVSLAGGVVAIVAFFLPWFLQSAPTARPNAPTAVISLSGWDIIINWATNGTSNHIEGGNLSRPGSLPFALLVAIPLLMALVAAAIGAISLVRRPDALAHGLYAGAAIIGLLTAFNILPTFFLTLVSSGVALTSRDAPLAGIGLDLLYLGYFGIVAGGVAGILRSIQRPAGGES